MDETCDRAAKHGCTSLVLLTNQIVAWCPIASVLVDVILAQTTALAIGIVAAASLLNG